MINAIHPVSSPYSPLLQSPQPVAEAKGDIINVLQNNTYNLQGVSNAFIANEIDITAGDNATINVIQNNTYNISDDKGVDQYLTQPGTLTDMMKVYLYQLVQQLLDQDNQPSQAVTA